MFVCPSDGTQGIAPTNWDDTVGGGNNLGKGGGNSVSFTPGTGLQDLQAPRISYTCNEALMPRPRGGIGGVQVGATQNVVSATSIASQSNTILITEFTKYTNAVSGTGPGGTTNKSHRPSDGWSRDQAGTLAYDTSSPATADPTSIWALSGAAANAIFAQQPTVPFGGGTLPHIVYVNAGRHSGEKVDNFVYADTHAKSREISQTFDCNNFQWGDKAYNQGGADVKCAATGNPVTVR